MSIATELTRIQGAKSSIKTSIEAKGVQVPANALIDDYSNYVDAIQTGGGGQAEQDLKDLIDRSITSITIPSGVQTIGTNAFASCTALTSVTIPNSVTFIDGGAFINDTALTSITFGNGLTRIGQSAFKNTGFTSLTIPNTVTTIDKDAFYGCLALTSVTLPNTISVINGTTFQNCSRLASVSIPNSVTSIGSYAFRSCTSLVNVDIPNSVTSIGESAFQGDTGIQTLTIGNGVQTIAKNAFNGCSGLTSVTINATTPPTLGNTSVFYGSSCQIYVPAASVTDYQTTGNWTTYASRIQAIPTPQPTAPYDVEFEMEFGNGDGPDDPETQIFGYEAFDPDTGDNIYIDELEIDGVQQQNITTSYQLDGNPHVVKVKFLDRTTIPSHMFEGDGTGWNYLTISDNITTLGSNVFNSDVHCYDTSNGDPIPFVLPSGVQTIGTNCFHKIDIIEVDSNNTTFDSRNECNCIIETATNKLILAGNKWETNEDGDAPFTFIPSGVQTIGSWSFKYTDINDEATVWDEDLQDEVIIPFEIPSTVTSIEANAFIEAHFANEETILYPNGMTVANGSFCNCDAYNQAGEDFLDAIEAINANATNCVNV